MSATSTPNPDEATVDISVAACDVDCWLLSGRLKEGRTLKM